MIPLATRSGPSKGLTDLSKLSVHQRCYVTKLTILVIIFSGCDDRIKRPEKGPLAVIDLPKALENELWDFFILEASAPERASFVQTIPRTEGSKAVSLRKGQYELIFKLYNKRGDLIKESCRTKENITHEVIGSRYRPDIALCDPYIEMPDLSRLTPYQP